MSDQITNNKDLLQMRSNNDEYTMDNTNLLHIRSNNNE